MTADASGKRQRGGRATFAARFQSRRTVLRVTSSQAERGYEHPDYELKTIEVML
jgi:hypothetical protein